MRNLSKLAIYPSVFVLLVLLGSSPVAAQAPGSAMVDFRMSPLEQTKKISAQLHERHGAGESLTVMVPPAAGDSGRHLILAQPPAGMSSQVAGTSFDSVSWHRPQPRPFGACDSQEECAAETDDMCENAGHQGVDEETVTVTVHADGSKTCSGDCSEGGAVAFITCAN